MIHFIDFTEIQLARRAHARRTRILTAVWIVVWHAVLAALVLTGHCGWLLVQTGLLLVFVMWSIMTTLE